MRIDDEPEIKEELIDYEFPEIHAALAAEDAGEKKAGGDAKADK